MSSETPIINTPKEKCRHDIMIVQQEHYTTECEDLDGDSLDKIDEKEDDKKLCFTLYVLICYIHQTLKYIIKYIIN